MNRELEQKLFRVRQMMAANNLQAVHIAQLGNLAWLLCGADLAVSLTDAPVAEVVVTAQRVTVLASNIEQGRLEAEELPAGAELVYFPWFEPDSKERLLQALIGEGTVLSDTPGRGWASRDFWPLRVPLLPDEVTRYRKLCGAAAAVFSEVLPTLAPGLTEHEVAGRIAEGLRARGMQPVVLLVGSDERLQYCRHPLPQAKKLETRVMVVACARWQGLYANLTRLVCFGTETDDMKRAYDAVLEVERGMLEHTRHGVLVDPFFDDIINGYAEQGHAGAWQEHHQGGPTGYFTRDFIAKPTGEKMLVDGSAYAWNPSLKGVKVEDTVLLLDDKLEVLTEDSSWPLREVGGVRRPEVLEL